MARQQIPRRVLRRLVDAIQLLVRAKPRKHARSAHPIVSPPRKTKPALLTTKPQDWSREYPGQEELLAYYQAVANKYNLYPHIRFNSTVESGVWDDETKKWKVRVTAAEGSKDAEFSPEYEIKCDFLVSGVGQLNQPRMPENIPGLREFQGRLMHSARWDWGYDLVGKRIAVIGNGGCLCVCVRGWSSVLTA